MRQVAPAGIALSVVLAAVFVVLLLGLLKHGRAYYYVTRKPVPRARLALPTQVPKIIWQTWHSTSLPPSMQDVVDTLKQLHPDFQHTLMNDAQCYDFVTRHYGQHVGDAFNDLLPGAFKADLWRLCVLHKYGGVYLDVKYKPIPPFTFHQLLDGLHLVRDYGTLPWKNKIFNAFMIAPPGDPRFLQCIHAIVLNVKNREYTSEALGVTGPHLVGRFFSYADPAVTMYHTTNHRCGGGKMKRLTDRTAVLKGVKSYCKERDEKELRPHYGKLWSQRNIFAPLVSHAVPPHIWQVDYDARGKPDETLSQSGVQYTLLSPQQCRELITPHFNDPRVLEYATILAPFCVLYMMGGVYVDITCQCTEDVKELFDKAHFAHNNAAVMSTPPRDVRLRLYMEHLADKLVQKQACLPMSNFVFKNAPDVDLKWKGHECLLKTSKKVVAQKVDS